MRMAAVCVSMDLHVLAWLALSADGCQPAPFEACGQLCTVVCCTACLQIGLFAVPFVTIVGWILGHPFSLGFDPFAGANATCCTHTHGA